MTWGPVKLVEPAVATHPAMPARRSVTRTGPSEPVTVWALELPDAVPRLTGPAGAPMPSPPPVTCTVTGVVAAEAGTARASTPAPPMNNAVAVAIVILRILLTPDGVFRRAENLPAMPS